MRTNSHESNGDVGQTKVPKPTTGSRYYKDPSSSVEQLKVPRPLHEQFPPRTVLNRDGELKTMYKSTPGSTISAASAAFGKLQALHTAIDTTISRLGSAALMRDLLDPPTTLGEIYARREAIRELRENRELREALTKIVKLTQSSFYRKMSLEESALLLMATEVADTSPKNLSFFGSVRERILKFLNPSRDMPVKATAIGKLFRAFDSCPHPKSQLLQELLKTIRSPFDGPDAELLRGKAVVRATLVETRQETPWYIPSYRINASFINIEERPLVVLGAVNTAALAYLLLKPVGHEIFLHATQPLVLLAFSLTLARSFFVNEKSQLKFQERVQNAAGVKWGLDSVGRVDALLSLSTLEDRMGPYCCVPTFVERPSFAASYKGIINPTLSFSKRCTPNDVELSGDKVFMLTGPNDGGKSTIATSLMQNQVLAQIGAPVAALSAELTIADKILYQGPTFKALGKHGKFGTEVAATKRLLARATPKSLVILDEVGDGTSVKEGRRQAFAAIWAFNKLKVGTILVTHNKALVKKLERANIGKSSQLEVQEGEPTFRVVPGIAQASEADRVAKLLKFSPRDIRKLVKRRLSNGKNAAQIPAPPVKDQ